MRWISILSVLPLCAAFAQEGANKKPEPTGFAPIAYFNQKCVYCHARDGASYVAASLSGYSDSALLDRLSEMTDEKARSPLADKDLEVLAAWFRALGKQEPFVVWTSLKDGVYTFEATKGASLSARSGTLKLEKEKWTLSGAGAGDPPVVTATQGRKKTVLKLAEASSSHAKKRAAASR